MVCLICQPINPVSNQPILQPVHLPTKQKIYQTVYLTEQSPVYQQTLLMESTKPCTNAASGPIYLLTHPPTKQQTQTFTVKPKHQTFLSPKYN